MPDEISRFKALAADPAHADNPLAAPLTRMIARYERGERRLERIARMGDRFVVELKQTSEALRAAHADAAGGEIDAADYVRSMLPAPIDGRARARWCFLPAREFSGGAMGYRWLPGGRAIAFFIVDAAGRGVRTSLLALAILNALHGRALATDQVDAPDAVLGALHAMFPAAEHNGLTTDIAYFVFDCESRVLRYAGTPGVAAWVLTRGDRPVEERAGPASAPVSAPVSGPVSARALLLDGAPIGAPDAGPYTAQSLKLERSAKVVLSTRGALRVPVAGALVPLEEWALRVDVGERDLPSLLEEAMRSGSDAAEPAEDCVVLEIDLAANMTAPRSLPPRSSSGVRAPWSSMDDAQEVAWVEALVARKEPPERADTEQLARRYVHLMRRLAKLTRISDAYQKELRLSNRQLEELNGDLDAFASRAAHDLKAPLTNVIELARLVADADVTPDLPSARALSADIARSSGKMVEIIDSLLMLARVRHQDIQTARLDMARVLAEVPERLRQLVAATGATLLTAARWPAVRGHASWVEAVWTNYISNAIKYGGRPPVVEIGAELLETGLVRHWVRDNGPGLDEAQRRRLFQPFTRLDPTRSDGHGLGLTIIRRIVERLGGQVGVDSQPGEGSTFWFTLPGAVEPSSPMSLRAPVAKALGQQRPLAVYTGPRDDQMATRHPLRVMVADDNAVNRKVAQIMLGRLGYTPDVAHNGREAIARAEVRVYDVVFMDVNMPDVDGLEATRAIRAHADGGPRPRIVALTGATFDDERARCAEAGMDDHVSKPVSLDELAAALAATPRRI